MLKPRPEQERYGPSRSHAVEWADGSHFEDDATVICPGSTTDAPEPIAFESARGVASPQEACIGEEDGFERQPAVFDVAGKQPREGRAQFEVHDREATAGELVQ